MLPAPVSSLFHPVERVEVEIPCYYSFAASINGPKVAFLL